MTSIEQSVEGIEGSGDIKRFNIESNHGSMMLYSSTCDRYKSAGPSIETPCSPQSSRKRSLSKPNSQNSEDHELSDAVELSTAASEALVMYELIKGEPYSGALSSTNILELALKVKQTRLEWLNDAITFSNSNDTISRSDVLSDLDDSDMEDAYGDVGLSRTTYPITSVSQVVETSISKQHLREDGTAGSKQESQEYDICSTGAKNQLEVLHIDLAVDSADAETENLVMNDDHLDLIPTIACDDNLMMHQLHQRNSDEIKKQQEDTYGGARLGNKQLRENFTVTSYLSESAYVAPDMNSCVNMHDPSMKISQSSIQIEGLSRTLNNGPMLSQNLAKDSILSSVDPLCSVIPCSISSRIHDYLPAHFHSVEKHNSYEVVMPEFDLDAQNMHKISCPNEIISSEKQDNTAANSFDSYLNQRHTASLNAYNIQSPEKQCLLQNDPNLVQAQQAEGAIYARSVSVSFEQKPISVNSLPNGCQAAKKGEFRISLLNEDMMPYILCHGARHRVQAHKHPIFTENEKQYLVDESLARFDPKGILQNHHIQLGKFPDTCIQTRKRVHFNDKDVEYQEKRDSLKLTSGYRSWKKSCSGKRKHPSEEQHCWSSQEVKEHLTNFDMNDKKKPIFRGLEFLLTGFPCKKEKEVERLLRKYGGAVLAEIPSPQKRGTRRIRSDSVQLPIVICTKKLRTRKFLYGCAVCAFLIQVDWVIDSIEAGSVLQPEKYLILPNQRHRWASRFRKPFHLRTVDLMFCKVGIMLQGEHGFCLKLAEVIKHGQGCVYKSLQGIIRSLKNKNISVGIIIADNESYATRHLRKCASEQKIPVMNNPDFPAASTAPTASAEAQLPHQIPSSGAERDDDIVGSVPEATGTIVAAVLAAHESTPSGEVAAAPLAIGGVAQKTRPGGAGKKVVGNGQLVGGDAGYKAEVPEKKKRGRKLKKTGNLIS
ncbi:hypothetical protein V2J09_013326 [Rumex salicifolius]